MSHESNDRYLEAMVDKLMEELTEEDTKKLLELEKQQWWFQQDQDEEWLAQWGETGYPYK